MAKSPKKADADPPTPPRRPNRTGTPINVWVDPSIRSALEVFIEQQRVQPKLTDVVELALQEFLTREGLWPPKTK